MAKDEKSITKKAKRGRPTLYTPELAAEICKELAVGKSLRTVCKAENMPDMSTVFLWLGKLNDDGSSTHKVFIEQYARAKQESADAMAEEIMDISDDARNDYMEDNYNKGRTPGYTINGENIQRSKLRVDTRKWLMAKMKPKVYGDKLDVVSGGEKLEGLVIIKNADKSKE